MLNEILFFPRSVPLYEYLYSHYPPYCAGAFYFMNINVMNKLINLFEEEFGRNYLWIEDVFLTGMYIPNFKNSIRHLHVLYFLLLHFVLLLTHEFLIWHRSWKGRTLTIFWMNGHKTLYKVQILCTANANSKIHETLIGNPNDQYMY